MSVNKAGDLMPAIKFKEPVDLPEAEFDCPRHGKYRGIPRKYFYIFSDNEYISRPDCPECKREADLRKMKKAELEARDSLINKYKQMNIDEKFWNESFETFDDYTDELKKHLATARKFAENPDGKLVMLGKNGNGKNHLAVSVLKEVGGVIYTATEISIMLHQSYSGDLKEWEIFDELCTVPLLVIDEVEKVKESEWKNYWMSHIVGKRYSRLLPIIFIANCHTQEDCREQEKPCPHCLEYHLENDVLSRIIEDGIIMKFTGDDYRYRKRAERRKASGARI
jgi:DNA replication protein DnaC